MAAPHAAGVAALLAAASGASPDAIAGAITTGARTSTSLVGKVRSGGVLDVVGSFKALGLDTSGFEQGTAPGAFRLKKPGKRVTVGRGGKVRFTWSRSHDEDLIGYEVYVDGKLKTTVRSQIDDSGFGAPNTFAKVKIKAGNHRWTVIAVDEAGNERVATRAGRGKGKVAVVSRKRR
jgi:subtilisin family serine protease